TSRSEPSSSSTGRSTSGARHRPASASARRRSAATAARRSRIAGGAERPVPGSNQVPAFESRRQVLRPRRQSGRLAGGDPADLVAALRLEVELRRGLEDVDAHEIDVLPLAAVARLVAEPALAMPEERAELELVQPELLAQLAAERL